MKNKNLKKLLNKMQVDETQNPGDFENLSKNLLDKVKGGKEAVKQTNYASCNASSCNSAAC